MKHTVILRGGHPLESVSAEDPAHDFKVSAAVTLAHAKNAAEGEQEIELSKQTDGEESDSETVSAPHQPTPEAKSKRKSGKTAEE